MTAVKTDIK